MQALYLEIKNLIISTLNLDELSPDDIDTDAALFGDGLGLDSIDALETGPGGEKSVWRGAVGRKRRDAPALLLCRHTGIVYSSAACLRRAVMTEQKAIYEEVSALLVKVFEIDPQDIKPEARLYEDLELDSIDAIDMIVHLQKKIGKKIKPEDFKTVRTVQDVVDAADRLLKEA